ncbi:MAG: (Fe-S)-binding protein [Flavobacteriales bacterium]
MISSIIFVVLLLATTAIFIRRIMEIRSNILLGRDLDLSGNFSERLRIMTRVALGQSKIVVRPLAGIMHVFIYLGFVIINIEILEIVIDGIFGTHRALHGLIGTQAYYSFIGIFEVLALLVIVACVTFLVRRNIGKVKRFTGKEMTKWPTSDANIILITETLLMLAFLTMNATDSILMHAPDGFLLEQGYEKYLGFDFPDWFWVSGYLTGLFPNKVALLVFVERFCWWFHIVGVFVFSIYVLYSKHFHIFIAFPNTFFSRLTPMGDFNNLEAVKKEVELMMDPSADPYAAPAEGANAEPKRFGAKDVTDLSWKQLMDAYSCTECGRCTSECPANQTGKLLSPRKIMMDTRDRLEEVGKLKRTQGNDADDGKSLLGDYISAEELWACTTCNACVQACPVNIEPLSIIVDLRRFLVMEQSAAPNELNTMFTNIENNGAPWQFAQADRGNWTSEA